MADTLQPFVYWGQKAGSVSLKVDLRDATVEGLEVTEDRLIANFDGVGAHGHKKYSFTLDFYLPVDSTSCKVRTTDRAVDVTLKKQGEEVWPRLTEAHTKLPWLKIDFDKFDVEDESQDEADKMTAADMVRQFERELGVDKPVMETDFKRMYLFTYNLLQFIGFFYINIVLTYQLLRNGNVALQRAFEVVGYQIMFCQLVSFLEVVHPALGLVKTGVMAPVMQTVGRGFILFMLILQDVRLQVAPAVWYLFFTWSTIELVRYPFYMLSSIGTDVKLITWLRYTAWIPLYPVGILFECTIVIMSIPLFEESGVWSLELPNSSNFAFYFPWFLHSYLLIAALGGIQLMKHMYKLRKKKLYSSSSDDKKTR